MTRSHNKYKFITTKVKALVIAQSLKEEGWNSRPEMYCRQHI